MLAPALVAAGDDALESGRAALRGGDYERAETLLAQAAEQSPERLDVRRDHGLALLLLRRYREACRELGAVAEAAPEDELSVRAHQICQRLSHRVPALRLFAEVAFQYDSNVVLDPTAPSPGWGAARTVVRLGAAGRLYGRGPFSLETGAGYYQSVHLDGRAELRLLDVSAPEATVLASVSGERLALSLTGRWRELWTDFYRVHYGRELDGEARLDLRHPRLGVLGFWYRLRGAGFFDVNLPGENDRNALYMEPGVDWRTALGSRVSLLGAHCAYLRNDAAGDNFDFHGVRLGAIARLPLRSWLELEATAGYTFRAFVNAAVSRADHEADVAATAALKLHPSLALLLGFEHVTNASTLASVSYQREIVSLTLRGQR